jgi:predicted RNase H-like HicB family nuclease
MSDARDIYTVRIHNEGPEERLWAEVEELPGCFASGWDMEELNEALAEAISLYLSEPGHEVHVDLKELAEPGVTEHRLRALSA